MKQNGSPSRRPFNPTESAPDFLGPIAPEVTAGPVMPRFPSFEELLAHETGTQPHPLLQMTSTAPPSKPATLFEGLFGGDATALMQDSVAHPERYDDETRTFLEELGAGKHDVKALPQRQAELLSRAVLDFAAFKPPKASPLAAKAPPQKQKKPALLREEGELPDGREPQVDIPGDPMSAYWWL